MDKKNNIFLDPDKLINKEEILNSNKNLICSLCKGIIAEPIELFCEHIFCSNCINNWSKSLKDKCPSCNKFIYKKPSLSEENKNLLSKLQFNDNDKVYSYKEYIDYLKAETNINFEAGPLLGNNQKDNENNNNNLNYKCNVCGSEYNNIIQKAKNKYEERNKQLTEELRKIYEYKRKLQSDIYENKHGEKMPDSTLIDKCKHFSGNYKPIFECCNNAYGCYICHDENECHEYQISKKVICLLCANIYQGNECTNCKVKQCYERKEN